MVKERTTENCDWGWGFFSRTFQTESEAREWLKRKFDVLQKTYTIHQSR